MIKQNMALLMISLIAGLVVTGCNDQNQSGSSQIMPLTETQSSSDPVLGKSIYSSKCTVCHGIDGVGSNQGPPLVHKIYEPGHHANYSFYKAVAYGVRSHHWSFGNMPPIPGVSTDSVGHIVAYIRQEQRLAGIK